MKQYKINYTNFMKGGVIITNTAQNLTSNYVLLRSRMNSLSDQTVNPIRVNITDHYVCGGNSCIYGPPFEGNILRLSIYHEQLILTELEGYKILKDISALPYSNGKEFIMTIKDFGLFKLGPSGVLTSPFNCVPSLINNIGPTCKKMTVKGVYGIIEHCEGEDLFTALLNDSFTDVRQIKAVIKNILLAVAFLHKNEIVHCDLKLENIALKQSDNLEDIRIIDFGGAKRADDGKIKKLPINLDTTPKEVIFFGHSKKSDIYSIGCMLLKILIRGNLRPLVVQPTYNRPTKKLRPSPITTNEERDSVVSPIAMQPGPKSLSTSPIEVGAEEGISTSEIGVGAEEGLPTSPIEVGAEEGLSTSEIGVGAEEGSSASPRNINRDLSVNQTIRLPQFIDTPPLETLYDTNQMFIPPEFRSLELENFSRKLLEIDFDRRYTAEEALSDPWLADI